MKDFRSVLPLLLVRIEVQFMGPALAPPSWPVTVSAWATAEPMPLASAVTSGTRPLGGFRARED
jgi:hypothetical protein